MQKMKRCFKYLTITIVLVAMCACSKEQEDVHYVPRTPVGRQLLDNCSEVARVFRDTTFLITVGVEETDLQVQTGTGYIQQLHIIRVDTNVPGVRMSVAMPNNSINVSAGWSRQTVTDMASRMDAPRARVVAMVNGDFWEGVAPIHPRGPVHKGGTIVSSSWDFNPMQAQQGLSFVGVRDNGLMIIAPRSKYEEYKESLRECTGAGFMLLSNGKFPGSDYLARDPRNSIGYTDDGIVWLLNCDGRKPFGADGMTYKEMAYVFQALGCVGAVNMDGGGSATMVIRHPIANVWQTRNSPSDGAERPVVNGWAVIVDEP